MSLIDLGWWKGEKIGVRSRIDNQIGGWDRSVWKVRGPPNPWYSRLLNLRELHEYHLESWWSFRTIKRTKKREREWEREWIRRGERESEERRIFFAVVRHPRSKQLWWWRWWCWWHLQNFPCILLLDRQLAYWMNEWVSENWLWWFEVKILFEEVSDFEAPAPPLHRLLIKTGPSPLLKNHHCDVFCYPFHLKERSRRRRKWKISEIRKKRPQGREKREHDEGWTTESSEAGYLYDLTRTARERKAQDWKTKVLLIERETTR